MFDIIFQKLYKYPRLAEPCFIGLPVKQGLLPAGNLDHIGISQDGKAVPVQAKVTSTYPDGSARYVFLRFMADLNANKSTVLQGDLTGEIPHEEFDTMLVEQNVNGIQVDTGAISFAVTNHSEHIFQYLKDSRKTYLAEQFVGPYLTDGNGNKYGMKIGAWEVLESGCVCTRLKVAGECVGEKNITFELCINCYKDKEWLEIEYRLINNTDDDLHIAALDFGVLDSTDKVLDFKVTGVHEEEMTNDVIFSFSGVKKIPEATEKYPVDNGRYTVGNSNYKTHFSVCGSGSSLERVADTTLVLVEGNEHYTEVLYGTFMADRTTEDDGICATIFQAQQNYPKAVKVDDNGLMVMLVPKDIEKVVMASGMSRNSKFLLHFHSPEMSLIDVEDRSLIYQMPDRPVVAPEVYKDADVLLDLFVDRELIDYDVELAFIQQCDSHGRSFGMLNWGDTPDPGYTNQNRGKGMIVWTNNEYDFPHACFLQYARTGERRFLEYALVASEHWMDVDVCHYSKNPLHMGGQWEHSAKHNKYSSIVPSHSWVEGLLDYYHFTGNERALHTAIGIGENILRLLETDTYKNAGESSARETGWALRTLTALYQETGEARWVEKADWIVGHFVDWAEEYGGWLAPYTDNTSIRVPFMISVAIGSLMRYYRVLPNEKTRKLMIDAVEDLYENCRLPNGMFYYKEIPSLNRVGNNTLLLEAMVIGFELTGEKKYLEAGIRTFRSQLNVKVAAPVGTKKVVDDAIIFSGDGTKGFAQSFIPLCTFYKVAKEQGII